MVIDRQAWPPGGRVGGCRRGPEAGWWALVQTDDGDTWHVYLVDESAHPPQSWDLFVQDAGALEAWITASGFDLVNESEDRDVEETHFGLRSHWREHGLYPGS